ncbi:MAG: type 2 periplasmic-binding domain-containing protein [Planctomycetota bacterium]|jgi:hypothetical protein
MAAKDFMTSLVLNQDGNSTPDVVDPFRDALKLVTGDAIELDPLTNPASGTANAAVLLGSGSGGTDWAYDSATRTTLNGDNLIFGVPFMFEPHEFASWYLNGGRAVQVAELATAGIGLVPYAIALRAGESGGWFKEPVTLKMMETGKYSTGEDVKYRGFGEGTDLIDAVFPAVSTPGSTPAKSNLQDFKDGVFTALEFGEPPNDASVNGGLFPNWPSVADSIIAAGAKHYYISSWFNPYRVRELWINKAYHDALSADDQSKIEICARAAMMSNIANSMQGRDAIIKQFQALGATIHYSLPYDVVSRLREAAAAMFEAKAAASSYGAIYNNMKAFAKANQVSWNNMTPERKDRFKWAGWGPDLSV